MYISIITGTSINFDFCNLFIVILHSMVPEEWLVYEPVILIWLQQGKFDNSSYERGGLNLDNWIGDKS